MASGQVIARPHFKIGDGAIDRRDNSGALQVQGCKVAGGDGLGKAGAQLFNLGCAFLKDFGRNQIA